MIVRTLRQRAQQYHGRRNTGDVNGHGSVRNVLRPRSTDLQEFCGIGKLAKPIDDLTNRQNEDTSMELS